MRTLRGAFTLVELLVVLAVIAILAALSLGGLSKLGASSDRSKAVSNMRQIGTGITLFATDNDGKLPGPLWPCRQTRKRKCGKRKVRDPQK